HDTTSSPSNSTDRTAKQLNETSDPTGQRHEALAIEAGVVHDVGELDAADTSLPARVKTLLIGRARDLDDHRVFHHVSLIAFLAWVGLGADGIYSSFCAT